MVARMTELKEKQEGLTASRLHGSQEPGSTKKEKDAKKDALTRIRDIQSRKLRCKPKIHENQWLHAWRSSCHRRFMLSKYLQDI